MTNGDAMTAAATAPVSWLEAPRVLRHPVLLSASLPPAVDASRWTRLARFYSRLPRRVVLDYWDPDRGWIRFYVQAPVNGCLGRD